MKRTPLARRTPLSGRSELKRTGRLAPRSERRVADMVDRRALVVQLLTQRPRCEAQWVCRGARAVDLHERLKRSRGGNILDPDQSHAVTLCRACHERTETHPAEATARRMLLPSWHQCPPVGPC